ncbi:MAG TPA: BamA/TamA family outer membrane protein [Gemmatimonadales bacterium]|nr:BamA/TamA family outer membrane protein [Gemmatimonadales bacterium]
MAAAAPALAAQRVWRGNLYPYAWYNTIDGLWGAFHYGRYSPVGFDERPEPSLAWAAFDAGASTRGSYSLVAELQAPAWWEGWRASLTLAAARGNRFGYYGLGNDTPYSPDSVTANGAYFYKVSRTHATIRATLQRRLVGPVRVLVGAAIQRSDFRLLPGQSVFRRDLASGVVDPGTVPFTDKVVRAGVIVDTRDNEIDPHSGLFVEALFAGGSGYTRTTAHARVHAHPFRKLILAARLAAEGMGGTPPLAAQLEMESSERPFVAVGGYRSLRGYYDGRFTGRGKLLGGVEARYAVVWSPSVLELKVVAFCDGGRVFGPGEAFRLASGGLHTSGGGELALRFLRNSLLVVGYGRGSEGGQLLWGTTWSF